jgi:hypothetical protein
MNDYGILKVSTSREQIQTMHSIDFVNSKILIVRDLLRDTRHFQIAYL